MLEREIVLMSKNLRGLQKKILRSTVCCYRNADSISVKKKHKKNNLHHKQNKKYKIVGLLHCLSNFGIERNIYIDFFLLFYITHIE